MTMRVSNNTSGKLDVFQVREIKKQLLNGEHRSVVARKYGVSKRVISNIDREITWKCVTIHEPSQ